MRVFSSQVILHVYLTFFFISGAIPLFITVSVVIVAMILLIILNRTGILMERKTGETLTLSIQTVLNCIGLLALCIRFCCVYPSSANPGHCRRITFFHITLFALYLFALGYFFHCGLHAWKNYESNPKNELGLGYNILTIFLCIFFINIFFYV